VSIRQYNLGSIVKPGFNPLGAQTTTFTYYLNTWGRNNNAGQLGLGNTTNYSSPKQVGSLTTWLQIASAYQSTFSITTDSALWSWGRNDFGQLGLGNTSNYSSPKQVGSLTNWLNAASGRYHTISVKTDGTLWSWGRNTEGQLGLGNRTSYSSPKQVGALTSWLTVAGGTYYSAAVKTDGTLWAWGSNLYGQLGLGNITNYSSPKQVGSLTEWSSVVGCGIATIAIKTNGTLWSWGYNGSGQLGLGNITSYSSPKQVGSLTTWSKTTGTGSSFVLAIKTDGTLWSWGSNFTGQLGLNSSGYTYKSSPNQVGSLTTWANVAGGSSAFSLATKTDGTIWSWGNNEYGQLGLNNRTNYSSPKQVGSETTWAKVAAGQSHSIGLEY